MVHKIKMSENINYKFREPELIEEFAKYVESTYNSHYGEGGLQSAEIIVDRGHGMGFFSGNIDKYNDRYSKKGDGPADWRKDIVKTIHYGLLKLYEHDRVYGDNKSPEKKVVTDIDDDFTVKVVYERDGDKWIKQDV